MRGTLETLGYTEQDAQARLDAFVACPRSYVVDVRLKPWCGWNPRWNRTTLQARYPKRYVHLPGLGNLHHGEPGQRVQLADPDRHIRDLAESLAHGTSYVLLCACKYEERCHRSLVARLIREALDGPQSVPPQATFVAVSLWDSEKGA